MPLSVTSFNSGSLTVTNSQGLGLLSFSEAFLFSVEPNFYFSKIVPAYSSATNWERIEWNGVVQGELAGSGNEACHMSHAITNPSR